MPVRCAIPLLFGLLAAASPAFGAGGVLEINHTCATLAGCFPGDTAGYPVTIASLGSYRLTSNLVVPDENTGGILVQADDVAIDLAGFAIVRADCVPAAAACARTDGSGIGIFAEPLIRGTTVRNGTIVGMGSASLLLGDRANVANLVLRRNAFGVLVRRGSRVQRCVLEDSDGISAFAGSLLTENVVSGARGSGLVGGGGSVISRNSVSRNGLYGILEAGGGSVHFGNTSYQNGDSGFLGALYSTLADNTTYGNGTDALRLSRSGIQARWSLVVGNTMTDNVQHGLESDGAGYRENVINGNAAGNVTGVAIDLGANSCNGTASCP
jgi:hypothetical protein